MYVKKCFIAKYAVMIITHNPKTDFSEQMP